MKIGKTYANFSSSLNAEIKKLEWGKIYVNHKRCVHVQPQVLV